MGRATQRLEILRTERVTQMHSAQRDRSCNPGAIAAQGTLVTLEALIRRHRGRPRDGVQLIGETDD